jgi:MFS family permease
MEKRTLFSLYFSIVAAILGLSIISPILPTISEDLGATGFWMGMIFSGYAISRAIIMPVMGGLSGLLNGLAAGMIIPIAMAYAGEVAQEGKEGRAMGIITMIFYLGIAVGPFIGGIFWHSFGATSVFYVMSGISVVALLLVLPFLPEIPRRVKQKSMSLLKTSSNAMP